MESISRSQLRRSINGVTRELGPGVSRFAIPNALIRFCPHNHLVEQSFGAGFPAKRAAIQSI